MTYPTAPSARSVRPHPPSYQLDPTLLDVVFSALVGPFPTASWLYYKLVDNYPYTV
jgi:hypothetical protein